MIDWPTVGAVIAAFIVLVLINRVILLCRLNFQTNNELIDNAGEIVSERESREPQHYTDDEIEAIVRRRIALALGPTGYVPGGVSYTQPSEHPLRTQARMAKRRNRIGR